MYEFDPEHAKAELVRTEAMSADPAGKRFMVARIAAAAQIDIAESLRVIAQEATLAMYGAADTLSTFGGDIAPEPEEDPLVEGDVVQADGDGEPGVVKGFRFTEGEYFAEVEWADGSGGGYIAASRLSRLVGDEGEAALRGDLDESVPTADLVDGEPPLRVDPVIVAEELADEIDDDFDGDEHADAESALAKLKANEAARKAAKKSGSKKGKK
jgi:hypothetical protein